MKKYIPFGIATVVLISFPGQSLALSCMDPQGMVDNYVNEPSYAIVTATAGEKKEHVKDAAVENDPNGMYDSGYTGQFLKITEVHKGSMPDSQWVYFERNSTWNYLCVGEPPIVGTENLYIVTTTGDGLFETTHVVGVFEADSPIAKDVLKELKDSKEPPLIYQISKADRVQRLKDELKDLAFIIKVKLSEWKFWMAQ